MFAPHYSATFATTKMWTNSTWAFYVLLDFYAAWALLFRIFLGYTFTPATLTIDLYGNIDI
jgi:hypothetical protein